MTIDDDFSCGNITMAVCTAVSLVVQMIAVCTTVSLVVQM